MTYAFDVNLTADEKVAEFVKQRFREARYGAGHLATCESLTVNHAVGDDGTFGCETGCEYVRLTATLSCDHGESTEYEYGTWGTLADLLEDLN